MLASNFATSHQYRNYEDKENIDAQCTLKQSAVTGSSESEQNLDAGLRP